jgi:hypothetical protein
MKKILTLTGIEIQPVTFVPSEDGPMVIGYDLSKDEKPWIAIPISMTTMIIHSKPMAKEKKTRTKA